MARPAGSYSAVEQVAQRIGCSPERLRAAMLDAQDPPRRLVSISVRGARWGRLDSRPGTILWKTAEELHMEPEDLRDAIAEAYQPEQGEVVTIAVRRPDVQ